HRGLLAVGKPESHGQCDVGKVQKAEVGCVDQREQGGCGDGLQRKADEVGGASANFVGNVSREQGEYHPGQSGERDGVEDDAAVKTHWTICVRGVGLDVATGGHVADGAVSGKDKSCDDDQRSKTLEQKFCWIFGVYFLSPSWNGAGAKHTTSLPLDAACGRAYI